jgi:FkbM family methyltransferase
MAFEPDPNAVRSLERNVEFNDLNSLVTVLEFAELSRASPIHHNRSRYRKSNGDEGWRKNIRMVNQQPLDSMNCPDRQPIMIKIDAEGYDEEVLRGAQRLLANEALQIIDIEWPNSASVELINSHHFTRAYYDPFARKLQREPADTFSSPNALFVRDWEFARSRVTTADRITVLGHSI